MENYDRSLGDLYEDTLNDVVTFGFIVHGTVEDFLDISNYIETYAKIIYEIKSNSVNDKLWIVKKNEHRRD